MAASTQLFDLIQSLSLSEKRYFRLYCNLQSGEKNYLKLFDFIDGMEEYDEEKVKTEFKNETFIKSLHVTKNYLYNLILKSLRSFHAGSSSDLKLFNLMSDLLILERRGLYDQARDVLVKIKKLGTELQRHHLVWWASIKELSFYTSREEKNMEEQIQAVTRELLDLSLKIELETKALVLNRKAGLTARMGKSQIAVSTEDANLSQFLDEHQPLHLTALGHYNQYFSIAAMLENDLERFYGFAKKTVEAWKAHPALIAEEPHTYKLYLANLLNGCFRTQRFEEFPALMEEFHRLPPGNFNEEGETFQNFAFYELLYFMNVQDFENAKKRLPYITEGIIKYRSKIHKGRELAFYYNLSVLHFVMGDCDQALDWLNRILHHPKTEHRRDLQRSAHILQLIYHYDLGNYELLDALLSSVQRKLARWEEFSSFEKWFFRHFAELMTVHGKKEKAAFFQRFFESLKDFKTTQNGATYLTQDEIYIWLEKKIA